MNDQETRAACLTPPGRGAVATVVVEGKLALAIVERFFAPAARRRLDQFPVGRIVFGHWRGELSEDHGGPVQEDPVQEDPVQEDPVQENPVQENPVQEDVVVTRCDQQRIEVHCHGGHAAPLRLLADLERAGCRILSWDEWLGGQDAYRAAAARALAEARTNRVAAVLLDQYRGALAIRVHEVLSLLEARQGDAAIQQLDRLLDRWSLGRHLVRGWRVALVGRPNVGKSSLFNAALGYRRVIVYEQPGTTRDAVVAGTAVDGWPVELVDTAGQRVSSCDTEAAGIQRARQIARSADLVVLVGDLSQAWSDEDQRLLDEHPTAIVVHNKCDLVSQPALPGKPATGPAANRPRGIPVSATNGHGLRHWLDEISRRLVPDPPAAGEPVPFTTWQADSLAEARKLAARGRWSDGRQWLLRALSPVASERRGPDQEESAHA